MNVRVIEIGRAAWGAGLLLATRPTLRHVHHLKVDTKSVLIARVLGARQLAQAGLSGLDPTPEVLAMGVWVDVLHASTAFGLAVVDRSRARGGITDGVMALGWAGFGYRDLVRGNASTPPHDRRRDRLARIVLGLVPGGGALAGIARSRRQRA